MLRLAKFYEKPLTCKIQSWVISFESEGVHLTLWYYLTSAWHCIFFEPNFPLHEAFILASVTWYIHISRQSWVNSFESEGVHLTIWVLFDNCLALSSFLNQTAPFTKLLFWDRASLTWYTSKSHSDLVPPSTIHLRSNVCDRLRI
jgi:hypothetical protein